MSNPSKVFISYSWTSEDYKATVLQLAEALVGKSIDVILDRWALLPGHDRFAFMEQSIEKADKVLVLCDKKYTEKANARDGGVGTETAIITPDIYGQSGQEKFIPVIMEDFKSVPVYLKSRRGIDFREGHRAQGFEEILRAIYNRPVNVKPPLGKPPEWVEEKTEGPKSKHEIKALILSFMQGSAISTAEIATKTGLHLASVHRILSEMIDTGEIVRIGRSYRANKAQMIDPIEKEN